MLMPVLLILTSLSIIWDFGAFTQPYLLIGPGHQTPDNYLMSTYLYIEGYTKTEFGRRRRNLDPHARDRGGAERRLRAADAAGG